MFQPNRIVPAIVTFDRRQITAEDELDYSNFFAVVREMTEEEVTIYKDSFPKNENKFAPEWILECKNPGDTRKYLIIAHMVKKRVTKHVPEATVRAKNAANLGTLQKKLMKNLEHNPVYSIVEITRTKIKNLDGFVWQVIPIIVS